MLERAADERNVVCKPEVAEVRVTIVFDKSDSLLVSVLPQ